ncbi:MAG: 16S rRNA (cytidine(1402)-2'-O)-methyltransferase [Patescibacteria group bacterium]|nr:16S rRNA (cytidine(1402)-2'-O)-methyltransferase [Patescibacteria group bacterium]
MGNLYIVATPIGNLQDISLRAADILSLVDFILCEDTRKTSVLIKYIQKQFPNIKIKARLISFYEENEMQRLPEILQMLNKDFNFALVSDAGTPAISDPGFKLIRECKLLGIKVVSVPGASSVISALVSSGLPTDKFMFLGFLPKKPGHRKDLLENVKKTLKIVKQTVIFFESPFRLVETLKELSDVFGDIDVVTARELTKLYEEVRKEKLSESIKHYENTNPKGEFVVLFNPGI